MTTKSADLPHLRSVVLAGHAGSGKTTLAEGLLFRTGATARLGRVDDGTSSLDFEPEEQKRHETLSLAVATLDDEGTRVTLIDTPGYPDFVAEVIEGVAAVDGMVFVMDAGGGVDSGLEAAVAMGRASGRAACFFINKCDRENADPTAALDALRATFGNKIAPVQLAIGAADKFTGYVDLVHRKAWSWENIPLYAESTEPTTGTSMTLEVIELQLGPQAPALFDMPPDLEIKPAKAPRLPPAGP